MKRAKQAGVFHTEQPFVFIDLSEQSDKSKQDDTNQPDKNNGGQLIQGVIDVYLKKMEVLFWWITKRIRCQKRR